MNFIVCLDSNSQLQKVIWNWGEPACFYQYVSIYYGNNFAFKEVVKARYRQTDTNPECETNTVCYIQDNDVIEERELDGSQCRANGYWSLSSMNDFLKLAGPKLK